jgi:hypothetical protein
MGNGYLNFIGNLKLMTNINSILKILIFSGLFVLEQSPAQIGTSNARSMGLAGAYSCLALGSEAPFSNMANLSYHQYNKFTMTLIGAALDLSNNSFKFHHYNDYNGRYLDDNAKQNILSSIEGKNVNLHSFGEIQALSLSYKNWAFSTMFQAGLYSNVNRDVFDLAFFGNELNRLYTFTPIQGQAISLTSFALSTGHAIPVESPLVQHLGWGITVKYHKGLKYYKIMDSKAQTLTITNNAQANGSILAREADGGHGFGVDLGSTLTLSNWRFSFNLQNALSSIHWNSKPLDRTFGLELYDKNISDILLKAGSIDSVLVSQDSSSSIAAFSTHIPRVLKMGFLRSFEKILIVGEWTQGFYNSAFSSKKPRISVGTEYRPLHHAAIRTGIQFWEPVGFGFSTGLGLYLGPIRWDLAFRTYQSYFYTQSKGLGLATSIILKY